MTNSPLSSDAITKTITTEPLLVTEYMPAGQRCLIINLGTSLVYLGTSSSVGPNTGVPLEPGTGLPWVASGNQQLYAVVAAGGSPCTLTVTALAADWTPSPAALATAVALELLEQGIPNVFVGTYLSSVTPGAPVDVSGYASIVLSFFAGAKPDPPNFPSVNEPYAARIRFWGQDSNPLLPFLPQPRGLLYSKVWSINTNSQASDPGRIFTVIPIPQLALVLPVRGPFMTIETFISGGGAATVAGINGFGTNRTIDQDTVTNDDGWRVMLQTGITGGSVDNRLHDFEDSTKDYLVTSGGPAVIYAQSPVAGDLYIDQLTEFGGSVYIHLGSVPAGAVTLNPVLPGGLCALIFRSASANAGTIQLDIQQRL